MDTLMPLAFFAFVTSITPGPNNIMLTSSGLRFGFVRTIPHIFGVTVGFCLLLAVCAAGIGSLLLAVPSFEIVLKVVGSAYLLWLAWKLRSMSFSDKPDSSAKPMSFVAALMFQFVNPKAWVMAITGVSAFLPAITPVSLAVLVFCLVFAAVNMPCVSIWAGAGAGLRRLLQQPKWQRAFCTLMVILTVYSALSIWK
jgi:threonine/homoserine/homoserine lactone efflux protein